MKIYNTNKDKYGHVIDGRDYLVDRGVSFYGTQSELMIYMKLWNLTAKVVNFFKQKHNK